MRFWSDCDHEASFTMGIWPPRMTLHDGNLVRLGSIRILTAWYIGYYVPCFALVLVFCAAGQMFRKLDHGAHATIGGNEFDLCIHSTHIIGSNAKIICALRR